MEKVYVILIVAKGFDEVITLAIKDKNTIDRIILEYMNEYTTDPTDLWTMEQVHEEYEVDIRELPILK